MHARNILVAAVAIAALAGPSSAAAAAQAGPRVRLAVFFERGGALWQSSRTVTQTPGVARAAIDRLFTGPNPPETAAGVGSAVPHGSRLRGISIASGTATIDVSRAFAAAGDRASVRMRVAQLVFTATQFPTIDHVRLEVAGQVVHSIAGVPVPQPAARPNFYRLVPAILVAQPAIGERIPATVTIAGSADVFEAALTVRITNAKGRLLARQHITATCGTGCRGTYSVSLPYHIARAQQGTVVIFDSGGMVAHPHVVRVPVRLSGS
jgi:Immunoglobulin-like domain of bacterial spore germination/Sporulation and spore germination